MGEFDRDRNLLFGVLAVQLRKLDPALLLELAAASATHPSRGSLSARKSMEHLRERPEAP